MQNRGAAFVFFFDEGGDAWESLVKLNESDVLPPSDDSDLRKKKKDKSYSKIL